MASSPNLSSRYEIRPLELKHCNWAQAIVALSNVYQTRVWKASWPEEDLTRRTYKVYKSMAYLMQHQIESGHSLGVFDKEYEFKQPESATTSGKLYWNFDDETASIKKLLDQMDFPLVSVAMAYDSFDPLNPERLMDIMAALPSFGPAMGALQAADQRDSSWKATGPGQVLFRAATSTRQEYEGKGIMKSLAHYLMRTAAAKGFRAIQIECVSDAVTHVWSHPPEPFHTDLVSEFNSMDVMAEDESGNTYYPLRPAKQRLCKLYCRLQDSTV
ncbi:hypothetical protein TsFJ059_001537 [Trichoderma semiorbis]|uniref:Uncharacterized protein n=1 Tax=Trichoderma semiorbis TaxID=1491008 RepID=A0A9P8HZP3_9HYPO|nr:hypothetical protein TsFJ059_001537 [Trichoderma semiorbis]